MEDERHIDKPEARYGLIDGHIFIDCNCGEFRGSYFQINKDSGLSEAIQSVSSTYNPRENNKDRLYTHTFYMSLYIFANQIKNVHEETNGEKTLDIVCYNCEQKFSFNLESYNKLLKTIKNKASK